MEPDTAKGTIGPKVRQLSVFLQNRVGLLSRVVRQLEEQDVHICAISIVDTADSAIVRMIVDKPAKAREVLEGEGYTVYELDLVAVEVPPRETGVGISQVLSSLLRAEVNVHYVYALIIRSNGHPVLAFHVDDREAAVRVLTSRGLTCIGQDEIQWEF